MKIPSPEINERLVEVLENIEELLMHMSPLPRPFPFPHKRLRPCVGTGINFTTMPPAITAGPLVASGFTLTDDDRSAPAPTPSRVVLRGGTVAFHCGYVLDIKAPKGCQNLDITYIEGGGTIEAFDITGVHITSLVVPNTVLPRTITISAGARRRAIGKVEIRSANEMYLLQLCCHK